MKKKIALAAAGIIILLLGYVALLPADYVVSRQITINAPAEKVFPYLTTNKLVEQWSPWKEIDPDLVMSYSGTEGAVGSKASWDSKGQMGTGSATVMENIPNQKLRIKLEYTKPMQMTQEAQYLIEGSGQQSTVTWRVEGKNSFIGRFMCLFMNMDKMVGGMFEKGLTSLKALVEKSN